MKNRFQSLILGACFLLLGHHVAVATPELTYSVERMGDGPIISPATPGITPEEAENIQGPSLIEVPPWISNPLGRYYLYFAHHKGEHIRMAYADDLVGPWTMAPTENHKRGVLHISDTVGDDHIASPDVHVDHDQQLIRMFFHTDRPPFVAEDSPLAGQKTFMATSQDGRTFEANPVMLGPPYFRVFNVDDTFYALAKTGWGGGSGLLRAARLPEVGDQDTTRHFFETRPNGLLPDSRHTAVTRDGDLLTIFYSNIGDAPERIFAATIDLSVPDWSRWHPSEPVEVMRPERPWEGAGLPIEPSVLGDIKVKVNQLRDPAVFHGANHQRYLLYSVAGESGIAIGRLHVERRSAASHSTMHVESGRGQR